MGKGVQARGILEGVMRVRIQVNSPGKTREVKIRG
jgi:hypothetical protein